MSVPYPTAAERRRGRRRKALTILVGSVAMVASVLVVLAILLRFAGGWGVPYFTFSTDRGSTCTNTFTGYVCQPTTLADVEYFGQLDLPDDTRVVDGTYRSTHDYRLDASLEVPAASSDAAYAALRDSFGACDKNHPSALDTAKLTGLCVMANDTDIAEQGEPDSRLYLVATGVRADGTRVVSLAVRSR